ncbi:MAG TPA: SDR family NAD(P)-dependent oxidoreductase [Candidatus Limnocylindria bacterium]|nr:SDR family NAD(P)-dependent oxidoreductase [Candidatus Limnocylindria bacterium]
MATRVLITGITGFVGSHLAERLIADGHEVHGIALEPQPHANLAAIASNVRIHRADLADPDGLRAAVAAARPETVVHLAGQAIPSLAQRDASGTIQVNVVGTANLLAALETLSGTHLVYASSADVYGVPDQVPVGEDAPLRPMNVYAASKAAAEALVREFGDRAGHPTVILRPANTNGPRQHPGLAASGFAKQIAEAEAGLAEPVIKHGRLDAKRDFLDVRDIAAAYAAAAGLAPERTETYNVGTGAPVTIERILQTLVQLARIPVRTEIDPERVRGGDPGTLALDASRFRSRTGWAPKVTLERSLEDTLDHWRSVTARAAVPAR